MNTHFTFPEKLKTAILVAGLILPALLSAQDYIYTIDTEPIAAKVTEISEEQVVYKDFDNLEGPVYKISAWRVLLIVFENGKEEIFAKASPYTGLPSAGPAYKPSSHAIHPLEYRKGQWYCEHERMSRAAISDYIRNSLYGEEYRKAQMNYFWGFFLTMAGSAAIVSAVAVGCINADMAKFERENIDPVMSQMHTGYSSSGGSSNAAPIVFGVIGSGCLGAGIPLIVKGNRGFRKIAEDYNRTYLNSRKGGGRANATPEKSHGASLFLGPTANGAGLRVDF